MYILRKTIILFVFFMHGTVFVNSYNKMHTEPDWIPPLKIPLKLTASFAEYRGGHFHGGADFSTSLITGHEVLAMKSGYVWRIKSRERGSGKTVYLRHGDGSISMYAHLEDFAPEFEALLPEGRVYFDSFPSMQHWISQGEVLGYSGESGAGLPHLHVEVRNASNHPVREIMRAFSELDTKPPLIEAIHLRRWPDGEASQRFELKDGQKVDLKLEQGPGALAVEVWDPANQTGSRLGVHRLSLKTSQGEVLYEALFDQIDYTDHVPTMLHFDRGWTRLGGPTRYVYKLYSDALLKSPHVKTIRDYGKLMKGKHELVLEAEDFFGNTSHQEIHLALGPGDAVLKPRKEDLMLRLEDWELVASKESFPREMEIRLAREEKDAKPGVRLFPENLEVLKSMRLRFHGQQSGKSYLVHCGEKSCYPLVGKSSAGILTSYVSQGGRYEVREDSSAPIIHTGTFEIKGLRKSRRILKIRDADSGVDWDRTELKCDAKTIRAVADPDRGGIEIPLSCQKIEVKACDRVANCAQRKLTLN